MRGPGPQQELVCIHKREDNPLPNHCPRLHQHQCCRAQLVRAGGRRYLLSGAVNHDQWGPGDRVVEYSVNCITITNEALKVEQSSMLAMTSRETLCCPSTQGQCSGGCIPTPGPPGLSIVAPSPWSNPSRAPCGMTCSTLSPQPWYCKSSLNSRQTLRAPAFPYAVGEDLRLKYPASTAHREGGGHEHQHHAGESRPL